MPSKTISIIKKSCKHSKFGNTTHNCFPKNNGKQTVQYSQMDPTSSTVLAHNVRITACGLCKSNPINSLTIQKQHNVIFTIYSKHCTKLCENVISGSKKGFGNVFSSGSFQKGNGTQSPVINSFYYHHLIHF